MKTIHIQRYSQDKNQTLGNCIILDNNNTPLFSGISLERGWRYNEKNISCVPKGTYALVYEWSPRFNKNLWELKNVPNRSECKFHSANYWHQLNGCISLGRRPTDINKDGYIDVTASKSTMKDFHKVLNGLTKVDLIIK